MAHHLLPEAIGMIMADPTARRRHRPPAHIEEAINNDIITAKGCPKQLRQPFFVLKLFEKMFHKQPRMQADNRHFSRALAATGRFLDKHPQNVD